MHKKKMDMAGDLLKKAIKLNSDGRSMESTKYYEDAIQIILDVGKAETDVDTRTRIMQSAKNYISHLEGVKASIAQARANGTAGREVEKYQIPENSTGYNYERIFGNYLNEGVMEVWIEEPYLNAHYQMLNLVSFCELLVMKCRNLKFISVTTKNNESSESRDQAFCNLTASLKEKDIRFHFEYDNAIHNRQIILNKHTITICRGLHIFYSVAKYSLGFSENMFRKCRQSTVTVTARQS